MDMSPEQPVTQETSESVQQRRQVQFCFLVFSREALGATRLDLQLVSFVNLIKFFSSSGLLPEAHLSILVDRVNEELHTSR